MNTPLLTQKQTAVETFKREDIKFGPMDKRMRQNMTSVGTKDKALRQQGSEGVRVKERL